MPGQLLHDLLDAAPPDDLALVYENRQLTFGELAHLVRRVAASVVRDTSGSGARVAVLADNGIEIAALLYGVPAADRLAVPLNTRLAPAELRSLLDDAQPELLLGDRAHLDALGDWGGPTVSFDEWDAWLATDPLTDLPAHDEESPAWLIFTSGTTGRPKGALISPKGLLTSCVNGAEGRSIGPDDVYLYAFPLFHIAAFNCLMVHMAARPVVLVRKFVASEVQAATRRHGVTQMSLAPTMITMLLDDPGFDLEALATLRRIGYGAAPMPLPLLRRILDETQFELSQSYGMTEVSGASSYLGAEGHRLAATTRPDLLGSAGQPAGSNRIRIVDDDLVAVPTGEVGEIVVAGDQVMVGYWRRPDVTAETVVDGWLRTGDLGRFDAEGNLFVVDRKKDVIVSGGENVSSREVEDAIGTHPSVSASAVVGAPHEKWGEAVTAFVVPAPGASLDADELIAHVRARLAGYKSPREVHVVDELPVNANGKIDKKELRRRVAG